MTNTTAIVNGALTQCDNITALTQNLRGYLASIETQDNGEDKEGIFSVPEALAISAYEEAIKGAVITLSTLLKRDIEAAG